MTTTPIEGYSSESIYLTNYGITTQLDGSISFDEDDFLAAYRSNPSDIAAIFASQVTTDSSSVTAQISGDDYVAGVYEFALSSGTATISSSSMISSSGNYYTLSGDTAGLTVSTSLSTTTNSIFVGAAYWTLFQHMQIRFYLHQGQLTLKLIARMTTYRS